MVINTILSGLPTKTPSAEGIAKVVLLNQREAFSANQTPIKEYVLVTTMTNPGMYKMIKEALAVACEYGGRTSHAAIVCSELGKPCVVGVKGLILAIRKSSSVLPCKIKVDGNNGTVTITDQEINFETK